MSFQPLLIKRILFIPHSIGTQAMLFSMLRETTKPRFTSLKKFGKINRILQKNFHSFSFIQNEQLLKASSIAQFIRLHGRANSTAAQTGSVGTNTSGPSLTEQILHTKTAEPKKTDEPSEEEKQRNTIRALKYSALFVASILVGTGFYILFVWGAPPRNDKGELLEDEFSVLPLPTQYLKRAWHEVINYVKYIEEPSRDKLLPDPLKYPYFQPPYTLLIELTGVLIYPDWTYKTGWRFKKRPGIEYFLHQLATAGFEIVIYTAEPGITAYPIIDALDTKQCVMYRLFKDSTKYENGVYKKELDKINRDLTKVVMVDYNEAVVGSHRNNALVIPKWKGNDDDRVLFELAALLQAIVVNGIEDVRGVLEHYSKFDDPIAEFRVNQKKLAEHENEKTTLVKRDATPSLGSLASPFLSAFRRN